MKSKFSRLLKKVPLEVKNKVREQNEFAEKLAILINDLGISHEDAAEYLGINITHLQNVLAVNGANMANDQSDSAYPQCTNEILDARYRGMTLVFAAAMHATDKDVDEIMSEGVITKRVYARLEFGKRFVDAYKKGLP